LPPTKLLKKSKELKIWSHYLARTSVGRKVSDGGDKGTPGYRRDWQESFRPKRMDILSIWKLFGSVISIGSGQ